MWDPGGRERCATPTLWLTQSGVILLKKLFACGVVWDCIPSIDCGVVVVVVRLPVEMWRDLS
jgi:hypothetical protein